MFLSLIEIAEKPDMREIANEIKNLELLLLSDDTQPIRLNLECKKLEYREKMKSYFISTEKNAFTLTKGIV